MRSGQRHLSWHPQMAYAVHVMEPFGCQHCHFPGQGVNPCSATGQVLLVLCCLIAQCQGVGWWRSKLSLPARRSLSMCGCWYTCNNNFPVISLLMYTGLSWSSPVWNARQRGLPTSLWWHQMRHWREGWRRFRQKGSCPKGEKEIRGLKTLTDKEVQHLYT